MTYIQLFFTAVALSADAFAVSVCIGLKNNDTLVKKCFLTALFMGGFQALMPVIGYVLGATVSSYLYPYNSIVCFVLLAFLGCKMIYEAMGEGQEPCPNSKMSELFLLAVATSIDALAVGISFSLLKDSDIVFSALFIGVVTFVITFGGVALGNFFGSNIGKNAGIVGGAILIIIGLNILFS